LFALLLTCDGERRVDVVRLKVGERAPTDADCISIEEQAEGAHRLTASALCASDDAEDSVSIIDAPTYATAAEAEEAGLAWAETVGAERLYIATGTLSKPLKVTEIDLPL
jgi:hypothetical protein